MILWREVNNTLLRFFFGLNWRRKYSNLWISFLFHFDCIYKTMTNNFSKSISATILNKTFLRQIEKEEVFFFFFKLFIEQREIFVGGENKGWRWHRWSQFRGDWKLPSSSLSVVTRNRRIEKVALNLFVSGWSQNCHFLPASSYLQAGDTRAFSTSLSATDLFNSLSLSLALLFCFLLAT